MPFAFTEQSISGVILVEPRIIRDDRGYFFESYKRSEFHANGICEDFVQENQSCSTAGVIRGLHYQRVPKAQGKLVRVVQGSVWDVAVDLRRDSPTFRMWVGVELSAENRRQIYLPPYCAHGFYVNSEAAQVVYLATNEYSPKDEAGIAWNDPLLAIPWPTKNPALSARDQRWPSFDEAAAHAVAHDVA
jgi:dTDP-4-dehydrorhamnose 3,5-epimerase